MRTLIAAGGTGGHLTPALAVAQALQAADPGGSVVFVSRRGGVGVGLITAAGFRLETIAVSGLDISRPLAVLVALARLPVATVRAWWMIRAFRADVVAGSAGYVCVPVVLAARLARVPVVLLEQNAVPGRAIRRLARFATVVATSFAETGAMLPNVRTVHTGNPVRVGATGGGDDAPPVETCRPHVLVTGGSQGARRVNRALADVVRTLLEAHPELRITHQCGPADAGWVLPAAHALPAAVRDRYEVQPFFDDFLGRMRDAGLVVMRAGGSSLAECAALGLPMILVPYPHAGGHQRCNAMPYVAAGAATLIPDEECSGARLRSEIERVIADPDHWRAMAAASASAGRPDAAARVAELLIETAS